MGALIVQLAQKLSPSLPGAQVAFLCFYLCLAPGSTSSCAFSTSSGASGWEGWAALLQPLLSQLRRTPLSDVQCVQDCLPRRHGAGDYGGS